MQNKIIPIYKIIILFLITLFQFNISNAEKLKLIEISGNERIPDETIIIFSELKINDDIDAKDLNYSIKLLYETDYFDDIKIQFKNGTVLINVKENPIIQSIQINGK